MNFKQNETAVKLRGGYYTPKPIAIFLSKWVLKKHPRAILEPGCGDGHFIAALKGLHKYKIDITGVELLAQEANKARTVASENQLLNTKIINTDFLKWAIENFDGNNRFDAVFGNPPYIRYQYLEESDQILSESIFNRHNLKFTKHTNAWVPFVIAGIDLLNAGGRLAMVVPSELLHVLHAGSLRKFLVSECSQITIIDPKELLFEEALQGTILLMVEKKHDQNQATKGIALISVPDTNFLETDPESIYQNAKYVSGNILNGKWMKLLLKPAELQLLESIERLNNVQRFSELATVDIGIVTGANNFFLVDNSTVEKYGLDEFVKPIFGRSEHCPGIIYDNRLHSLNQANGLPVNFLMFGDIPFDDLPPKVQDYIRLGEKELIHKRYKCRIRTPWYSVPSIYSTRVGMLKRSHQYPRLILNKANTYTTDTSYRIKPLSITSDKLVFCFLNSLTALSAELEGRHYGGGVLELVPSEIEKLLIPVPTKIDIDLRKLNQAFLDGKNSDFILADQDKLILRAIGMNIFDCSTIHNAWQRIRSRRQRIVEQPEFSEE